MKGLKNILGFLIFSSFLLTVPRLYGQPPPPTRRKGRKIRTAAIKKTAEAVVHLEILHRQIPARVRFFFPYYPFMAPLFRGNVKALAGILNTTHGSGFLINPRGYILTNAFIVNGADIVRGMLANGRPFHAKLIGSDPGTDLALLKLKGPPPYPSVIYGKSHHISIGQKVFALGRAEGCRLTMTEGILSAEHKKDVLEPSSYKDFLQTDAQISLENTGGPLVDTQGEVIGINDALLTCCSRFQGIGFAIPWGTAAIVVRQILRHGKVEHGWLGLRVQNVVFRSHHTPEKLIKGVMAVDVLDTGPAWKAGMKPGDVITTFDGKAVQNAADLVRLVSNTPIGYRVRLGILRNGIPSLITVQIAARSEWQSRSMVKKRLGIAVTPYRSPLLGIQAKSRGLMITWVDPDGPMERAGFEPDDIIVEANGLPTRTLRDLENILVHVKPGSHVLFLAIDHRTHRAAYVQVNSR